MTVGCDIHAIGARWTAPGGPSVRALADETGIPLDRLRGFLRRAGYTLDREEATRRQAERADIASRQKIEADARMAADPEEPEARRTLHERAEAKWQQAFRGRYGSLAVKADHARLPKPETHVHTQSSAA